VSNLKEAIELYLEEMGMPETSNKETFLVRFDIPIGKVTKIVGQ
jgi:predicted RNase H-like HicB family nuclease